MCVHAKYFSCGMGAKGGGFLCIHVEGGTATQCDAVSVHIRSALASLGFPEKDGLFMAKRHRPSVPVRGFHSFLF